MKIRSAVPENGCLVFFDGREKTKKNRKQNKTSVKHIRIRLIGGCVNIGAAGFQLGWRAGDAAIIINTRIGMRRRTSTAMKLQANVQIN